MRKLYRGATRQLELAWGVWLSSGQIRRRCAGILAVLMVQFVAPTKAGATSAPFIIFFDHDSAELDTMALHVLVNAARARSVWDHALVLSGYADASGSAEYNEALSLRRASAVKEALTRLGAPPSYLRVKSFGEARPLQDTPDEVKEPLNRRVELTFTTVSQLWRY